MNLRTPSTNAKVNIADKSDREIIFVQSWICGDSSMLTSVVFAKCNHLWPSHSLLPMRAVPTGVRRMRTVLTRFTNDSTEENKKDSAQNGEFI